MRDRILYAICFGFVVGVLLRSFLFMDFYFVAVISVIFFFLILFFLARLSFSDGGSLFRRWAIIFSCFVFAFCLGVLRFHAADRLAPQVFESKVGENTTISGEIIDEPNIKENNQALTVEIKIGEEITRVLVTADIGGEYKYGDEIILQGKLEKPANFITDTGKEFDYINYLRKDGILYTMYFPEVEVVDTGEGNKIKSGLFYIKNKFLEKINFAVRSPENLLMGGLILGEKSAFSEDMRKSFIDTGTIHIVALSGYNISLVAGWFVKIFSVFSRNFSIGAGILSIFLFILMTGASSTAIRAGIMATLSLYALISGRNYEAGRGLLLAGMIMIIINPYLLSYDVSFQLSFMATFALIFFTPKVKKYFRWVPKIFKLREIATVTFAVYVFVLPFIIYKMGNLSLVALLANFLVLPFIPPTMILGFTTGFLGMIHYVLAVPVGFVSYLLLHYELGVIEFFSKIPFAALTIPNFPLWITIAIYLWFTWKLFGSFLRSPAS